MKKQVALDMTTTSHIFRGLVRKTVASNTLAVKFTPEAKGPRYLPKEQASRRDGKAVIEMPCSEYRTIDQHATDAEIDNAISKTTVEDALLVFSHEYGHHLTQNPGYDEALKRCLTLPVDERNKDDIELVIKEESEAWSLGFAELESL